MFRILSIFLLLTTLTHAQVSNVSSSKISLNINGNILKIPYYRNVPLGTTDPNITRAVIIIHGTNRNADDYYNTAEAVVLQRTNAIDSTIIIAPQFLTEEDIDAHSLDSEHLYWSSGGWKNGSSSRDETTNPRPERISSFAVLDTIMRRLADNLPGLRIIVLAGHSAGGQYVNRYTATSPIITMLCNENIPVRSIEANPSSYLYMNNERRKAGTVDQFEVPVGACGTYNDYKYGLDNLYSYPAASGASQIRIWYGERAVVHLLGGNDNDPNSSSLDVTCEAMEQGDHRLERGAVYYHYLQHYYGAGIMANHVIDTVPDAGHNNYDMFTSAWGVNHIMAYSTDCGITTAVPHTNPADIFTVYPNPADGVVTISRTQPGTAILEVYDLSGRLHHEEQAGGNTVVSLSLPSGLFIVKLTTTQGVFTRKVLVE